MKILALDPATKMGFAHTFGVSGTWDLSVRRDESAGMRLIRLSGKLNEMRDGVGVEVVVFEAARNCAPKMQGTLVVQAEFQAVIKLWCEENQVEYRGYSPTEIKKHATGKGNANKLAMVAAAKARFPGINVADDNQADALLLLDLARKTLIAGITTDEKTTSDSTIVVAPTVHRG
jgi:Holliday junction resolvasome RuvABC endonuclease subunit